MAEGIVETNSKAGGVEDGVALRAMHKLKIAWTSAAGGGVTQVTTAKVSGYLVRCVTKPGATTPSDLYDLVIEDEDGVDILAGGGANRSNSSNEQICPLLSSVMPVSVRKSTLTVKITNAGDSKTGTIILYFDD